MRVLTFTRNLIFALFKAQTIAAFPFINLNNKYRIKRRVACAISGGIDSFSAVAALLLKRRGFDVVGVHMINWDAQNEHEDPFACPRSQDLVDAQQFCDHLGIQLHQANFVKEYWNDVFTRLMRNYQLGRTVVPDVDCNRFIKFDLLWRFATQTLGVDTLATGHFARTSQGDFLENAHAPDQKVKLLQAHDPLKDQTFFLASLNHAQLRNVMFPLGSLYKSTVRQIAAEEGLDKLLTKRESMGICFIGKKQHFDRFLSQYIDPVEGLFVDLETGNRVPNIRHTGVHHFTLGKRIHWHGAGDGQQQSLQAQIGNTEPLYVAGIDAKAQIVYVCRGSSHPKLYAKRFLVSHPNWICGDPDRIDRLIQQAEGGNANALPIRLLHQRPHSPRLCRIKRHNPHSASADEGTLADEDAIFFDVELRQPMRAAAPGQICSFYVGDECLGCAEIERVVETL